MSLLSGVHVENYLDYGFPTAETYKISTGLQIAWEQAESFINTNLRPTSYTDEYHPWPPDGILALKHPKLITVDALTARHDVENCSCDVNDYSGCELISNYDLSTIVVRDCNISNSCVTCGSAVSANPRWAIIDYTAGYQISDLSESDKYAICLLASIFVEQQTGDMELGSPAITSFRSMSYSETRLRPRTSTLGSNYRSAQAYDLLKHLRIPRTPRWGLPRSARMW